MTLKKVFIIIGILIAFAVPVSALMAQQRLSNEVDSYTHLNSPIRLTKVGDLPSQILPSENYSMHFIMENLGKKDYQGRIVIEISTGYYVYPINVPDVQSSPSMPPTWNYSGREIITPPPYYPYPILTPDMVTVRVSFSNFVDHWNNALLELTYNQTESALVGYTPTFNMPIGFYEDATIIVTFNDNAFTDTNYYLHAWIASP
jgi:hypothetical protein